MEHHALGIEHDRTPCVADGEGKVGVFVIGRPVATVEASESEEVRPTYAEECPRAVVDRTPVVEQRSRGSGRPTPEVGAPRVREDDPACLLADSVGPEQLATDRADLGLVERRE